MGAVGGRKPRAAGEAFAQRGRRGARASAVDEYRQHQFDECPVGVGAAEGGLEHEAVDAGSVDDRLDLVGDLLRVPGDLKPADGLRAELVQYAAHPHIRVVLGIAVDERLPVVGAQVDQSGVGVDAREVDAGDPGEHDCGVVEAEERLVLGAQSVCLFGGRCDGHRHAGDDLDVGAVAAVRLGLRADVGDVRGGRGDRLALDEHRLGVARRIGPAAVRGAGLEQHGRALRRGRHGEDAVRALVLAVHLDAVQLLGVGVEAPRSVAQLGVVVPAVLPEPQARVEEVIGGVVALVVGELLGDAEQLVGGGLRAAGDDVPADATAREPVERGEPARGGVGLLDRRGRGDDEPEVLGRPGERRDGEHGVEGGELDAVGGDLVRHPPLEGGVAVGVGEE